METTRRGKTAVLICSTAFEALGRAQARNLGYPEMPMLVVPHPFGSRTRDEINSIAEWCADELAKLSGEAT